MPIRWIGVDYVVIRQLTERERVDFSFTDLRVKHSEGRR